ncbi:MAG TPA: hypothetical protein VEN81_14915 [Planctomycetota bacterium]|nr:hypothetical protein [Planctomycetota bacterium]
MGRASALAVAAWAALLGCGGASRTIELEDGRLRVKDAPGGSLEVFVAGASDPILGSQRVEPGSLVFEPRFPLREGLEYRAVFTPPAGSPVERLFSLPPPPQGPPTEVLRVFPSTDVLPENQLKFYLHFSAPMSRGEAYRRIHLVEAGGRVVELPFLELGEELWDPSGTRLTLFFDPGRIKRGLKPREEAGPSLEEGKSYSLVVDRDWLDASGRPLKQAFRKSFRAAAPDDTCPDPTRWTLEPPHAGTRDPLTVVFEKPMDAAMLQRVLGVVGAGGAAVAGKIQVDREERRWRLFPDRPWAAGRHELVADTELEDLAGNSIARPFEIDVVRPIDRRIETRTVRLGFDIRE